MCDVRTSQVTDRLGDFYYRGPATTIDQALSNLQRARVVAVDMETVSTNDLTAIGVGVYISPTEGFYFPLFPNMSEHTPVVMAVIEDARRTHIYHNGNGFDLEVLDRFMYDEGFGAPDDSNYQDTGYMALCNGLTGGLQRSAEEELGYTNLFSIQDLFAENHTRSMLGVPEERSAEKCLNDCRSTFNLYEALNARLSTGQRDCYDVDRKLIPLLRRMQRKGLALRQGILEEHRERLSREVVQAAAECDAIGFNPGSPMQVGYILTERGNALPFKRGSKKPTYTTDEETLEGLDDPLAATILRYRHARKLLGTYVLPWVGKERAYTHLRLDLSTGRLASGKVYDYDPVNRNLQNIPPTQYDKQGQPVPESNMRAVFKPDSGKWSWGDHGQIELRVLAYVSHDKAMMAEYAKDRKGGKPDLHAATQQACHDLGLTYVTRDNGKTFNFARVFQAGDKRLAKATGVPIKQIPVVKAAMASRYPESELWLAQQMKHHGRSVEGIYGRTMRLPEYNPEVHGNKFGFEMHVAKCAVNYPIQNGAAEIVKRGMLLMDSWGLDMRLQVHDEYLVDGDWLPDGKYVGHELANIHPELNTPFEVKSGLIWT